MPKNFLIPAYIKDIKPKKNYYFLGMWCHEINKNNIFRNFYKLNTLNYHWENKKKLKKDFIFLKKLNEELFNKLYKNLNRLHKINKSKNYWRVIIYPWLAEYTAVIFDRWETVNLFEKKNKKRSFHLINVLPKEYSPKIKDHREFTYKSCLDHNWNHSIFQRIINYKKVLKIESIKNKNLLKYKNELNKKKIFFKFNFLNYFFSYLTLKFNKIIFDSFFFPKYHFVKLSLKNLLIPYKIYNFFDIIGNNLNYEQDKRDYLKDLLKFNSKKKNFDNFLINNLCEDMPKIYLENFSSFLNKIQKFVKRKKIIFTMLNIIDNDYFKIFVSEAKKNGSKLIISDHGGGLKFQTSMLENHYIKICEKFINYDFRPRNKSLLKLSPSLELISKRKFHRNPKYFSIFFWESSRYPQRVQSTPYFTEDLKDFKNLITFVKSLRKNIFNKIRFRVKSSQSIHSDKIFINFFGEEKTDQKVSKNSYFKLLKNSKLALMNYPSTALSESLFLNIPTIIICKKEIWNLNKIGLKTFEEMKKQKMAFENYSDAKAHIFNIWNDVDAWWNNESTQRVRNYYLKNFFNVEDSWQSDWEKVINKLYRTV